ncbi:MAG TPA: ABC transporter permease, partial [Chryseolinea sp.]|nr:ABC transporter permease [Chryseolinea sp.]
MRNEKIYPPKRGLKFLKWFCPAHHVEEIEGDLLQRFHSDVKRVGVSKAKRRLIWNTIRFFRTGIILRNRISMELNHLCLLRAYVILATRTMAKNKVFSLINILGLSASIVVAILILFYVRFELSYDDFHHRAENIYRVSTKVSLQNELINHETNTYEGISKALKENFSEVHTATSIYAFDSDKNFIRYENDEKKWVPIQTFKALDVDSSFFQLFSFPLLAGNPNVVLKGAYSALISDTFSKQYFSGNPVGKILEVYDGEERTRFKITGILKDIPWNSHVKFDLIVRGNEKNKNFLNNDVGFWDWGSQTYIRLHDHQAATHVESKLNDFALSNNGLKKNKDDYGQNSTFELQPLRDIHLKSHISEEFEVNGSIELLYALSALAFIIIIIAWINYINLSTAVADDKMKSIGVRKVIGASRTGLIMQVFTESA